MPFSFLFSACRAHHQIRYTKTVFHHEDHEEHEVNPGTMGFPWLKTCRGLPSCGRQAHHQEIRYEEKNFNGG
ncbi:MAG: hypothetical protein CVU64_21885 [Deltaproteobacteria bacterium HGW-Deltaproteobacteria-21]|jgi:hypothetical protein|nr:MAG: hypothetical protein CVU64_21885 [Deltaproteobacteria bacterium HGW-Deltaproteobacteria-21]